MSNARDLADNRKLTQGSIQTLSGNTTSFSGLPVWVKRITIQFLAVSLNAAGILRVRLGTSGGLDTSNYSATSALIGFHGYSLTNGLPIDINSNTLNFTGQMIVENIGGNSWVSSHTLGAPGNYVVVGGGYVGLTSPLTQLQIAATDTAGATSGSINYDAGYINIIYE